MTTPALERLKHAQHLLGCPDTHHAVVIQEGHLVCPKTGRVFETVSDLPALLPLDWTFTPEILEENKFYDEKESHTVFTKSHALAHLNARLPIRKWCESIGMTMNSWVLNVGAGTGGPDLQMLRDYTENILAIDVSPSALNMFVACHPFPCLLGTANRLPLKSNSLDGVVMSGVLHHAAGYTNMAPYLREALRVLKPGGAFISIDPNLLFPVAAVMTLLDTVGQRIKPGWRHHVPHERPLIPISLQRNVQRAGFSEVQLLGTSYVHNKFPWSVARFLESATTPLAKKPAFRHFGYWVGCSARKPA